MVKLFIIILDGSNSLITPEPGLLIWSLIVTVLLWVILGKFAFKPIMNALNDRSKSIEDSLKSAENARKELAELQTKNEDLLKEAREERNKIINEAKIQKEKMIAEAKNEAKNEASKITANAMVEIQNQKNVALAEVKSEVGKMAIDIAEKILRKELSSASAQEGLVNKLIEEAKLN